MCPGRVGPPGTDERREMEEWLRTKRTSPKTGEELRRKELCPNHTLRGQIKTFLENRRKTNTSV